MLSPVATEAIYSATYVDNYIDSVENLPDDVQRHLSRIRDIDVQYRSLLRDVDHYYELWKTLQNVTDASSSRRGRAIARMQQSLIQAQELGDEKMAIVNQLQELIDHKTRQLDTDQKNLDIKEEEHMQTDDCGGPTPLKQSRTQSPARCEASIVGGGSCAANGGGGSERSGSSGAGGGGSTPNSERSSNGATNGTNTSNSNLAVDTQRSANKRSRRRNENAVNSSGNMELGGNESNSANEAGSNGGSGGATTQKSTVSSSAQKKNVVQSQSVPAVASTSNNTAANVSGSGTGSGNNSGKKKKRKARGTQSYSAQSNAREETPPQDPIDPDEPTYCVCNQISFGEMILCDNDLCPIEWFHFSCVSLVLKPKGRWYCPNCRGDRPNVMKPKAQFLKELERYNKEKEEKT